MSIAAMDLDSELTVRESGEGSYESAPMGVHQAVCVDVIYLGKQKDVWEGVESLKDKIAVVWQIEVENGERQANGRRFEVTKRFTRGMYKDKGLRLFLEQWRGRPFTAEEAQGFNLKTLLGANCMLQIALTDKGKAKIAAVMAYSPKFGAKIAPENYTRSDYWAKIFNAGLEEKNGNGQSPAKPQPAQRFVADDPDIPF